MPAHPPGVRGGGATVRPRPARGTVYASWNGATLVAAWRVLAGPSATRSLTPVAQVAAQRLRDGDPVARRHAPGGTSTVQALDAGGAGARRRRDGGSRRGLSDRHSGRMLASCAEERG